MTRRPPTNLAASVRARLLNVAHAGKLDYLVVLQRFALERLLHRLILSPHADREHGALNTRLKDYYEVWWLMERQMIDDDVLADAVAATFARRKTPVPTAELQALSSDYAHDPARTKRWRQLRGPS